MELMRIVVTGPVGAGKSTFIRSVSEIQVVDTDRRATDETKDLKDKTTVSMDFGRLNFGPEMAVHLYGTPGQSRFDFMWDILIRQAHAYIVLVPANRPREFRNTRRIMNFMNQRVSIPAIVGITHSDCEGAWGKDNIALALGLGTEQQALPVVELNANEPGSVARALLVLVERLHHHNLARETASS